jgi:exodeoxyribonuclease-3
VQIKIATFNINNVNNRLTNLLEWLARTKPDVVCLQELKATDRDFRKAAIEKAGYGVAWRGQKSWMPSIGFKSSPRGRTRPDP